MGLSDEERRVLDDCCEDVPCSGPASDGDWSVVERLRDRGLVSLRETDECVMCEEHYIINGAGKLALLADDVARGLITVDGVA